MAVMDPALPDAVEVGQKTPMLPPSDEAVPVAQLNGDGSHHDELGRTVMSDALPAKDEVAHDITSIEDATKAPAVNGDSKHAPVTNGTLTQSVEDATPTEDTARHSPSGAPFSALSLQDKNPSQELRSTEQEVAVTTSLTKMEAQDAQGGHVKVVQEEVQVTAVEQVSEHPATDSEPAPRVEEEVVAAPPLAEPEPIEPPVEEPMDTTVDSLPPADTGTAPQPAISTDTIMAERPQQPVEQPATSAEPMVVERPQAPVEREIAPGLQEESAQQPEPEQLQQGTPQEVSQEPPLEPRQERKQEPVSEDHEMTDVRASQGKIARGREDDVDEGPAAKRTRTDEESSTAPDFKVPELPKHAEPTGGEPSSAPADEGSQAMTKAQHKYLLSAIRVLKRNKNAGAFKEPVDPIKLGIPTYPDVIKNPMDLGTMEQKLKDEAYQTVDEYTADFHRVVDNCATFNGPDHFVTNQAKNLLVIFERQMSNLPKADALDPAGAAGAASKKAKKAAAPKAGSARRESRSSTGAARSPTANTASSPTTFALAPSGTPLIRRDSTAGDGRPKREIHPPPPRDLPYSITKPKKKKFQWELKFCQEALNEMNKPRHADIAHIFYNPVDPVALNIPHYHKIVKRPMDLGTISSKLKNGQYENAKEFEADMRLMFANCYKFNPPADPIHQMGRQVEAIFNDKWQQKNQWISDHAPSSSRQSPSTSPEPDEDDDDEDDDAEEDDEEEEEDEAQSQLKALQKQIEAMSKQVELIQKKKSSPPAPASGKKKAKGAKSEKKASKKKGQSKEAASSSAAPAAAADKKKKKRPSKSTGGTSSAKKKKKKKERTPYVTYEQKQEISNRINTLPPSRMSTALNIIRDNMPNLKGIQDDELELDIDELSDEVLHKLYQFVQKYAPGGNEMAEPVKPARPKPSNAGRSSKPKKNKPMSRTEQEARISELQGKLKSYERAGSDESPPPAMHEDEDESSGDDDDESGSESEEE